VTDAELDAADRKRQQEQIAEEIATKRHALDLARLECEAAATLKPLAERWAELAPHLHKR
jgi:hypothetical protein